MGTAFVLDIVGKQYLVSAFHVLENTIANYAVDIRRGTEWVPFVATPVGVNVEADVAVVAVSERLVGRGLDIQINSAGCAAGQEVFFLGYPFGIAGPGVSSGWPLPLIRRGIASNFYWGLASGIYVSGSANPGFSGGPTYYVDQQTRKAILTAIVIESIASAHEVRDANDAVIGHVMIDSNIVRCCYIDHALKLIDGNPVGFSVD